MKIADLKYQSVAPSNPSPNTLGLYANSGNAVVYALTSGGVARSIGSTFTGNYTDVNVATGRGVLQTGTFFGGTGAGIVPGTGLASPFRWLNVFDQNGTNLVIPAYLLA